jgi:hypothetical protein
VRGHRLTSFLVVLALLALTGGGWWLREWMKNRPKPYTISVEAKGPELTPLEKELHPRPLVLQFGGSVAQLAELGKRVTSGVRLEPATEGHWIWAGESRLEFFTK